MEPPPVSIITLTTDFGLKDGNIAVMKGVIRGIAPEVELVDLSHLIRPQDIREGAWVVGRSAPYFPAGTIHVVVVDPGVGTARRPIAARLGDQNFVGPDNGLLTPLLEAAERSAKPVAIVWLDQPRFWRSEVSDVFHGRDIFSPAAAHWASGVGLNELGTPIHDPVRLSLPRPVMKGERLVGEVMHVDSFGNLASNIRREDLAGWGEVEVRVKGAAIAGLVRTFGEKPAGALIALYGSTGNLIVSVVNGNAAEQLRADVGDEVAVVPAEGR
jgi:S-adenosylmethionine hydrolase